jgi:TRAP-type C4-dicarboxylate transport system permease small subunit
VISLSHGLVLLFALTVMVGGGLRLVQLAFQLQQISAAMGIRMGYVYLAVPLSGLLIVFFSAVSMVAAAGGRYSVTGGTGDARIGVGEHRSPGESAEKTEA